MKTIVGTMLVILVVGSVVTSPAVMAQQKTVKECSAEWRASKDANKAAGITEKDYVAKCRGAAAAPPAATAPASGSATAPGGQAKTAKECRDEWRANKDANKAGGITEKDYVAKCRAGTSAAAGTHAPAPAPSTMAPAVPAPAPAAAAQSKLAPSAATVPTGANQYPTEVQAKTRCPSDTVVWVNLDSKIYHFSGNHNYGKTKEGAYMCEKDALGQSFNAAKNEKHP